MKEQRHPLEEKDWPLVSIINYRNCLVEKVIGGYKIWQRIVETPKEVDEIIDKGIEFLGKSIKADK